MANVLTEASKLLCGLAASNHGGSVTLAGLGEAYFKIGGNAVLTLAAIGNAPVATGTCNFSAGGGPQPCTKVSPPTAGGAQFLTVGSKPVALTTLVASTIPNASSVVVDDAKDDLLSAQ